MKRFIIISCLILFAFQNSKAQSTFVGGLFPTIDHSGTITKHLDYSFYYFGAFPLVNFNKPDISKDANFLLFHSEQALNRMQKQNNFHSWHTTKN